MLTDAARKQITGDQAITDEIIDFYKKLLGLNADYLPWINLNIVRACNTLSSQARDSLVREVTTKEIDKALAGIDNDKAPG